MVPRKHAKRAVVQVGKGRELGRGRTMRDLITVFSVAVICWLVAAGTMGCFALITRLEVTAPNAYLSLLLVNFVRNTHCIIFISTIVVYSSVQERPTHLISFLSCLPRPAI